MDSYLTFRLGEERFALSVRHVINILEMCRITVVPQMPDFVKGAINLRGEVLPVIDSRLKFGMSEIEITKNTCILVLEVEVDDQPAKLGILVDAVDEVLELDESDIKNSPTIGKQYNNEFIAGMIEHDDKFTMLLNINKVFSTEDIVQLREVQQEAAK